MNATQKQSLVAAVADFYEHAEELGSKTQFPDASYFAKHPSLHERYKAMLKVARVAGWCDDSFIDVLARDVSTELRRRKRASRRGQYLGLTNAFAEGVA